MKTGTNITTLPVTEPPCLPEAVERIARLFKPLRIILFGSWARGQAHPDSDLDLLVVLSHIENKRQTTIHIGNALSDLPVSKDIVVTTPEEIAIRGHIVGQVLRQALREGKTIYERPRS
jgi:predicted nucleotidyltransferase